MQHRLTIQAMGAAVIALVMASLSPVARAGSDGCERRCTIEAANKYLAALVSHDGSDVPFHPDAWRQENGGGTLVGGENIREALASPIMYVITGIHDLRWFVDGDDAMAVYFLDTVAPTYIFERFRVDDDGLITQIDAHFYIDIPGHLVGPESILTNPQARLDGLLASEHGPAGPVPLKEARIGDALGGSPTTDDVAGVVAAYLAAMASGDAASVPLADGATQTINHRPIADIAANLSASAATISAVPDPADPSDPLVRYLQVDGDEATILYHLELTDGSVLYAASRIKVAGGEITEIESVCDGAEVCA